MLTVETAVLGVSLNIISKIGFINEIDITESNEKQTLRSNAAVSKPLKGFIKLNIFLITTNIFDFKFSFFFINYNVILFIINLALAMNKY
ncbi:hypothetical protein SDC9_151673 [bioreactor metagenome]|uniref:Uncharacterized protein n=1 Tax=bioreactor metagenome TaxID=1076179 RepID=A0A645EQX8_9ZZZZ